MLEFNLIWNLYCEGAADGIVSTNFCTLERLLHEQLRGNAAATITAATAAHNTLLVTYILPAAAITSCKKKSLHWSAAMSSAAACW
jgi:hypothetical protein